jgi:hypothetical protein
VPASDLDRPVDSVPEIGITAADEDVRVSQISSVKNQRSAWLQVVTAQALVPRQPRVEALQRRVHFLRGRLRGVGVEVRRFRLPTSTVESKTVMATAARWAMLRECRLSGDDTQHRRFGSSGAKKTGVTHGCPSLPAVPSTR